MDRRNRGRNCAWLAGALLALAVAGAAQAQSPCERDALAVLRNHAALPAETGLGEAAFAAVCQDLRRGPGERYLIDEAGLRRDAADEAAPAGDSLARACVLPDRAFLARHAVELAEAWATDEEALALARSCRGGLSMSLRWSPEREEVTLRVAYAPAPDARAARVTSTLQAQPQDALACDPRRLHEAGLDLGGQWAPGVITLSCARQGTAGLRVFLASSAGELPVLALPPARRIELRHVTWAILSPDDHHDFHCKDLSALAESDADRDEISCDEAPCRATRWDAGVCNQLHPDSGCFLAADEQRLPGSTRACH